MSYDKTHTEDDCDKCLRTVGKINLHKLSFIYKDYNDKIHPELHNGYRQYYVCSKCLAKDERIKQNR